MAKQLNAEQKTISQVFTECKKAFLIPEYQRPYSWERDECLTLWENLYEFAFPNDTISDFDADEDNYFMGTILTFKNDSKEYEVIDGQQRIVTFLLILRAFYEAFGDVQDDGIKNVRRKIEGCIWKLDEDEKPEKENPKLKYEVIADGEGGELKKILATGSSTPKNKSNYAANYRLFQTWITNLNKEKTGYLLYFARRILNNCVLLPIEADSQNTALRIFTTLNDRGMPLTNSDIFRAQFYKFFSRDGKQSKEDFTRRWKELRNLCNKNFHPRKGTPTDDLFMRYSYYARTKKAIEKNVRISDTFDKVRDFYSDDDYAILQSEKTFEDLELLANFWNEVNKRNEKFSLQVLKKLYVLSYAPQGIWSYVVSLYFMSNRELGEEKFCAFLDKVTAMILMNAVLDLGKQNIRRPFVLEFKNIYNGETLEFDRQFKFQENIFRRRLADMRFGNNKPITRAMLAWWTFRDAAQDLPPVGTDLHIEHIYAKNRHENFEPLNNPNALEFLGNKALLEERINIGASDYRFADKKKYYTGWQPPGKGKKYRKGTFNIELRHLAETRDDFTEDDILARNEKIFDAFVSYLREQNLLI